MTKPIQIRKEDVVRDIRELASLTDRPITEAVAVAVKSELNRARHRRTLAQRNVEIDRLLQEIRALPKLGPMLTDEDLYDEDVKPALS
jgi:hypothetical protein